MKDASVVIVLITLAIGAFVAVAWTANTWGYEQGYCEGQGKVMAEIDSEHLCVEPAELERLKP